MASGTAMSGFGRYVDITGPTYLTSQREVINDAQKTNYATLGYMLRGQQMSDVLQGGNRIKDNIMLSLVRTTHTYLPGAEESVPNPQTTTTWTTDWRFWLTPLTWIDQAVEMNADASREAKFQAYKNEWFRIQQDGNVDWCDKMEEFAWAPPDKSKMEAQDGQEPFSIPCFVNEYTDGLPASSNQPGGTWTTKMTIDPTAAGKTKWKPQRFYYGNIDPGDKANLVNAFDRAYLKLNFKPPPVNREYFEGPTAQPLGFIACSALGISNAQHLYRAENDRWENMSDPYNSPLYGGRPFVYVAQLDDAAIYPTGTGSSANTSALGTETDTTNTVTNGNAGPRYFILQPKYLRWVFHRERYMKDLGVMTDPKIPTQHVKYLDTWGNLIARSLNRHAIIVPNFDI